MKRMVLICLLCALPFSDGLAKKKQVTVTVDSEHIYLRCVPHSLLRKCRYPPGRNDIEYQYFSKTETRIKTPWYYSGRKYAVDIERKPTQTLACDLELGHKYELRVSSGEDYEHGALYDVTDKKSPVKVCPAEPVQRK